MITLFLSLLAPHAPAAVPEAVRPSIVSRSVEAQYLDTRASKSPPVVPMACEDFWESEARLCFRVVHGNRREWVTTQHLKRWGVSFEELKSIVIKRSKASASRQLKPVQIGGMEQTYFVASNENGWASAVLLHSSVLGTVSQQNVFAAVPAHGMVLVWEGGNPEVDKILAVGVRELYESKSGGVTPIVYRWSGAEWVAFGEAKKNAATPK